MNVREIACNDVAFPYLLKETPWSPQSLYIKGVLPGDPAPIGIVGTRKAAPFGQSVARSFAAALARRNIPVVSGLAFGIDAAAHRGALEAGGRTFAVLPCGLSHVYPKSHEHLAEQILDTGGGLISEYPPAAPALKSHFLERNRIIAGLCRAIVIIEAPWRSGALATARYAGEAGRDVYVFPGRGGDPNYAGSHALIREGCILVDSPEDLFSDLQISPDSPVVSGISGGSADLILTLIRASKNPLGVDEMIEATTLAASEVNRMLMFLSIQGLVKEEAGRYTIKS